MKSTKDEFLEILSNYQGILHKVSFVYFKNKPDREDNLQEIIYQLWKSFPSLKNQNSIGSWIYAVSINTSISRIKKVSRIEYRETVSFPFLGQKLSRFVQRYFFFQNGGTPILEKFSIRNRTHSI
jgi:DNA-directed RNA polymerase specialized sigma24 family protein